jgi:hypothetical protein
MLVYITRYATTLGILALEGEPKDFSGTVYLKARYPAFMNGSEIFREDKDAFRTLAAAQLDAEKRFGAKLKAAEKALKRAQDALRQLQAGALQVHDLSTLDPETTRNAAHVIWAGCKAFPDAPKAKKAKKPAA